MARARNELWDELDALFEPCRTKTEASFRGRVVKELQDAGATVEELRIAYAYCRKSFDIFGEGAILKNFSRAQMEHRRAASKGNVISLVEAMARRNSESQVDDPKGT